MACRFVWLARDLLCAMLVTPLLLGVTGLLLAAIFSGLAFVFTGKPITGPPTDDLWLIVAQLIFWAMSTSAASFITSRIGQTLPVAVVSALAPWGFVWYMQPTHGIDAREPVSPLIYLLLFTS